MAAVLGGIASLGLASVTGWLSPAPEPVTTTVVQAPSGGSSSAAGWEGVYSKVGPSVVDIDAEVPIGLQSFPGQSQQESKLGSGVVLDGRGHILTAAHVVSGAQSVTVTLSNGDSRAARVLGTDPSSDIAILQVNPSGLDLHPASLGDDGSLLVGEPVAAIGDPLGFDRSISTGVVSALDRTIQAPNGFSIIHAIQTDAALNPGNSGGPLLNPSGQVIGIADQIVTGNNQQLGTSTDTSTGVGLAVPISIAVGELSRLESGQSASHAYLGVSTAEGSKPGALVVSVQSGTPAASAGLRPGDLLVSCAGQPISDTAALISILDSLSSGKRVTFSVVRGSKRLSIPITLTTQPAEAPSQRG
jgi:putative serine protease PepD